MPSPIAWGSARGRRVGQERAPSQSPDTAPAGAGLLIAHSASWILTALLGVITLQKRKLRLKVIQLGPRITKLQNSGVEEL